MTRKIRWCVQRTSVCCRPESTRVKSQGAIESGMRSGKGRDDGPFFFACPGRSARVPGTGADLSLHGVVFAILCPGLAGGGGPGGGGQPQPIMLLAVGVEPL